MSLPNKGVPPPKEPIKVRGAQYLPIDLESEEMTDDGFRMPRGCADCAAHTVEGHRCADFPPCNDVVWVPDTPENRPLYVQWRMR